MLLIAVALTTWVCACLLAVSLVSAMETASSARHIHQSEQDGRIRTILGEAVRPTVSSAYVRSMIEFPQEDIIIYVDGSIAADNIELQAGAEYSVEYIRGPARELKQIHYRKAADA
ncbi:hypothetical protein BK126_11330 [Paenibacillus sp. FSL H7-0326]|uniref:hypothetical protein n=1 Tax=Paenibacillus sp. FSL H7-0326 TaxID=1921144 RepID=UPI00096EBE6D|nr:hypothetical protein [Paenibacillus sp. FSL H7-0326]OMC68422.1 hypothetical protein BK126_11330 [Paenibacillus sp. FSL H7-0326]